MAANKKQQQQRRATLRSHPARDQLVDAMRSYDRPISPTRLSKITGATLGSVAYHMRTLASAGVIELADERRVRGAVESLYALVRDEETTQLTDPIQGLLALCGALMVPPSNGGYPHPANLDDEARDELRTILDDLRPEVQRIVAEADHRSTRVETVARSDRFKTRRRR